MYKVIKEYQYVELDVVVGDAETYEEATQLVIKDYPGEIHYIRAWGNVNERGEYRDLGSHSYLYKIVKY